MQKSIKVVIAGLGFLVGCADADLLDPSTAAATGTETPAVTEAESAALALSSASRPGIGRIRCPSNLPAALNPPADATLEQALAARGVQIYTCAVPAAGGAPAFALKAPHATLSEGFDTTAIHFAGPSWQALDGSLVTATRLASAPAPDTTAIPWLLLQAALHVGAGSFADVTIIQRLDTVGGLAPATGCDDAHLGVEALVPYRANYFFYHTAASGERIRQCSSP
jgi:hypothetical protein